LTCCKPPQSTEYAHGNRQNILTQNCCLSQVQAENLQFINLTVGAPTAYNAGDANWRTDADLWVSSRRSTSAAWLTGLTATYRIVEMTQTEYTAALALVPSLYHTSLTSVNADDDIYVREYATQLSYTPDAVASDPESGMVMTMAGYHVLSVLLCTLVFAFLWHMIHRSFFTHYWPCRSMVLVTGSIWPTFLLAFAAILLEVRDMSRHIYQDIPSREMQVKTYVPQLIIILFFSGASV